MSRRLFTSESVTGGHPDKLADQISDSILDRLLERDPGARVACEALVAKNYALVAGEVGTEAPAPDYRAIVRETILSAGYTQDNYGINGRRCDVECRIHQQSPEIGRAVEDGGAGDQGLMFGYATDETPERMPAPIVLAHQLARRLISARTNGALSWLRPDGKTQVTIEYAGDRPLRVHTVVVSAQHDPEVGPGEIRRGITEQVIEPVLSASPFDWNDYRGLVNPSGGFVYGGPYADVGLTGRKIIVDTYGGAARHGGGAFSGKDATKVDRSAAYAARWAAGNVVAAGLARRCEIQLAYAIGKAEPVSVAVDTFGTGRTPGTDRSIADAVREVFDFRPASIIGALGLRNPIFTPTSVLGHFGRTPAWAEGEGAVEVDRHGPAVGGAGRRVELFAWEKTDQVQALRSAFGM